jgi:hypothetical protein
VVLSLTVPIEAPQVMTTFTTAVDTVLRRSSPMGMPTDAPTLLRAGLLTRMLVQMLLATASFPLQHKRAGSDAPSCRHSMQSDRQRN